MLKKLVSIFLLLFGCAVYAQRDSILLDEVVVDSQLRHFSNTQTVTVLTDSILSKNRSLTDVLRFNTTAYFKENGYGMVSSVAMRGTTAQQTAVIWNGINLNSQFNGQTDFNGISIANASSIEVRAGGGSVLYGSSAIGGTVHLNSDLHFGRKTEHEVDLRFGSFNTKQFRYRIKAGNKKFTVFAGVSRIGSDNDYEIETWKNINGEFHNTALDAGAAYKINEKNVLKLFSRFYEDERHFSLLFPTDTKTKYRNFNTSNLLEWESRFGRFTTRTKAAFLTEQYRYFHRLDSEDPDFAKAETAVGKFDLSFSPSAKFRINAILDYSQTKGLGSNISANTRGIASAAVLLNHRIANVFGYEIGIRKEATPNYDSPLLYSAGIYSTFGFYTFSANASHNFRIPTFNDLYWTEGGNPDLKPESSRQIEIGNKFVFKHSSLKITGYAASISDLIQWLPGQQSTWNPQNVKKVDMRGIEAIGDFRKKMGGVSLHLNATYAYTISENEDGHQLIYVPIHKATASASASVAKFSAYVQGLFNGEVFTRSDNNRRYNLDPYAVFNFGIDYKIHKDHAKIAATISNAFDQRYETVIGRPLPGRHFSIQLLLNL